MFEITSDFPFLNSDGEVIVYSWQPATTSNHNKESFKFYYESENTRYMD